MVNTYTAGKQYIEKTSCPTNRSIIQMQIHLPFLFLHEDDGHEYMEGQTVWIFSHDHYVPGYPLNASQVYAAFFIST